MDQAPLTEVDKRVYNLETDVNHGVLDTAEAVETLVQRAKEDGNPPRTSHSSAYHLTLSSIQSPKLLESDV